MAKVPHVYALIVTYNRLPLLRESLEAIEQQSRPVDTILVVDNCSTDGTAEFLADYAARQPKCRIVRPKQNIGGAGGFSLGVKEAVVAGADYTWLMDDDTIPQPTALENLLVVAEEKQAGYVCSRVLWTDGNDHPRNPPGGKYIKHYKKRLEQIKDTTRCDVCTFVSVLISSRAVFKVGLPIKEFFIWCDDVEYTWRISQAGFPNFYCPHSLVVHKTKEVGSYSVTDAPPQFAERFYYQVRNSLYLKHRDQPNELLFRLSAWNKLRRFKHRIKRRKDGHEQEFLEAVRRGIRDGLKFNPSIEYVQQPSK